MHLIQILLPLYNNDDKNLDKTLFADVKRHLVETFGGLTTYTRTPAEGFWQEDNKGRVRDDIIVYEVMTKNIDKSWWKQYRQILEKSFAQETIINVPTQ